jgi:hypothetical protein
VSRARVDPRAARSAPEAIAQCGETSRQLRHPGDPYGCGVGCGTETIAVQLLEEPLTAATPPVPNVPEALAEARFVGPTTARRRRCRSRRPGSVPSNPDGRGPASRPSATMTTRRERLTEQAATSASSARGADWQGRCCMSRWEFRLPPRLSRSSYRQGSGRR